MIDIVIVDDEANSIEVLEMKIARIGADANVLGKFTDPDQALKFLRSNPIDLLFLDVEMPGMSGFELLECLDTYSFAVVFVTAYDDYALKALRLSALDYLLKPVDIKENYERQGQAKRISLVSKESIDFVSISSIVFCNSQSNYTSLRLENGKSILMSKTLKEFELLLDEYDFIRVHHSYLINKKHVKAYIKKDGGYFVMSEDSEVPVSRSRREEVLKVIR